MNKIDIKSYTGEDKPPTLVVTFTAAPGQDNLPNLKRTIVLSGIKSPNRLMIERKAMAQSVDLCIVKKKVNFDSLSSDKQEGKFNSLKMIHVSCV